MKDDIPVKVIRVFKLVEYLTEFPPKTVEKLSEILSASIKTIYKDLHLIETLGYEIEKDNVHRYCIRHSGRSEYHLNEEEKKLIIGAIKNAGLNTTAITSITQKLKSNTFPAVGDLTVVKQINIIKKLLDAIKHKNPLTIHNYKSTSPGNSTRDREILPLYFDEMRMSVTAYDMNIAQVRIFKVARMSDIVPIASDVNLKIPIEIPIVDTFGYAGMLQYDVSLLMTRRAASILAEEFMTTASQISDSSDTDFPYRYTSKVCGYEGVGRFVLGMMTEIKVIGDDGFVLYLKNKIDKSTLF